MKELILQRTPGADVLTAPPPAEPGYIPSQGIKIPKTKNKAFQTIAVVSEIHYLHPSLHENMTVDGARFIQDRMHMALIEYSDQIFRQVLDQLKAEQPDVVLIPGDLTKAGEPVGHEAMAQFLGDLKQSGMNVYVIPGACDINNAGAKIYFDTADSVANINSGFTTINSYTEQEFLNNYSAFGYGTPGQKDIIATDAGNSRSYVAEPFPGLRILAIDTLDFSQGSASVNARRQGISTHTLTWIKDQVTSAPKKTSFIAMMYRSALEHFEGQSTSVMSNTVINNWNSTALALIDAGLQVIFTGGHANDIAFLEFNGRKLYDVQVGSLVTPPSQFRVTYLDLKPNQKKMVVTTRRVPSIQPTPSFPGTKGFPEASKDLLRNILINNLHYSADFANAFMAYIAGEHVSLADWQIIEQGLPSGSDLNSIKVLLTDVNIQDDQFLIVDL